MTSRSFSLSSAAISVSSDPSGCEHHEGDREDPGRCPERSEREDGQRREHLTAPLPDDIHEALHALPSLVAEGQEEELRRRAMERIAKRAVGRLDRQHGDEPAGHRNANAAERKEHGEDRERGAERETSQHEADQGELAHE